jgi:hypothetical protein
MLTDASKRFFSSQAKKDLTRGKCFVSLPSVMTSTKTGEPAMSHLVAQGDGYEVRHYTYAEARATFSLPSGPVNVEELSRYLSDKAHSETAGNCGRSAEDNGEGVLIKTVW